ncbi:MAG: flagellar hook protein FlgE [Deltaproteobacteria bacterium]|nr:flagellar hook protein FlgE [Deltaproteobacteria bacterium]
MSINGSFYTGLSGLSTHGTAIGVVGDNVANVNTTGFKNSSTEFSDILGMSLSGVSGANQMGAGANIESMDTNFVQGTFITTDVPTDIAVNGKGFYILKDASNQDKFYSRAGHFHFDNQGYFVNTTDKRVQGYLYDSTGTTLIEALADVQIDQNSMIAPKPTSAAELVLNLDSSSTAMSAWGAVGSVDFNAALADPTGHSNYSTPVTIYDTLGQSHTVQVYFTKTAASTWEWHAAIAESDASAYTATYQSGNYVLYGQGITADTTRLQFDANGVLTSPPAAAADVNLFDAGSAIVFENGVTATAATINYTGTTQYGSSSAIQSIIQDGYAAGTTSSVGIDDTGDIVANYTNGQVKKIARLALGSFLNINGLFRRGATMYQESVASGQPIFNKPGEGGMGTISSSMLEESNVDLAAEIIKMIVLQRGYQANSKVISTTDEMLNTLLQLR